ncbi:Bacterial mobilisation protein (MobC) [Actinomyces bovis]|uniref:Bacterial mobilisation protein (MobC) n=2 Tax=Actinomyces bovis TaxID=1658 RepID=A0ABY1VMY9_9ACTO|nr:Bacterial mobilisation protein (MobC) [Actinomyces bovis]VEG55353.1 Bacterial mobilisation protein (MobC) [Actinomyces israelii]
MRVGRRERLTVYLTPQERELLELRAETSGESMAKILVDAALRPVGGHVDVGSLAEAVALLRGYRRQLEGACTNLNQIAHHANTVCEIPSNFADVLSRVEATVDEVNDMLVSVRR